MIFVPASTHWIPLHIMFRIYEIWRQYHLVKNPHTFHIYCIPKWCTIERHKNINAYLRRKRYHISYGAYLEPYFSHVFAIIIYVLLARYRLLKDATFVFIKYIVQPAAYLILRLSHLFQIDDKLLPWLYRYFFIHCGYRKY